MTITIPDIEVAEKNTAVNPRQLRREGSIPATVYGRKLDSYSVQLDKKSFTLLHKSQDLNLVTLVKGAEKTRAVVKKIQKDPITFEILNVEFLQVKEDQKVKLSVPLVLEGESPAVKLGGVLLQIMDYIDIECLPKHIPEKIVVDLTKMDEVGVTVTIAELDYPEGVVSTMTQETAVLNLAASKVVAEGEEEGESSEGAEGEEAAADAPAAAE